jgi:hypothetical protein
LTIEAFSFPGIWKKWVGMFFRSCNVFL